MHKTMLVDAMILKLHHVCMCAVGAGVQPISAPLYPGNEAAAPSPAPAQHPYVQLFASQFGPFPVSALQPLFGNNTLPPPPFSDVQIFVKVDAQVAKDADHSLIAPAPAISADGMDSSSPQPGMVDERLVVASATLIVQGVQRLMQPLYLGQLDICRFAGPSGKPSQACRNVASRYLEDAIDKIVQVGKVL